ncbi:MAG TPA: DUF3703 domain-containing protein [Casimicrobiaceae bacterium]|jgi:hypothetical protein
MNEALHDAIDAEVLRALEAYRHTDYDDAFHHLERAHILCQRFTIRHVQVHCLMLKHGIVARNRREVLGQLVRIIAAALFSRIWVPTGNTGGANVSAMRPMSIPDDLRQLLEPPGT